MKLPALAAHSLSRDMISTFGGYHHHSTVPENSFFDMKNLSSDHYPALSVRRAREIFASGGGGKSAMIYTDKLCYVNGPNVVIGSASISCGLSTTSSMLPKQLVSMGIYLLVFPDHYYINTLNTSDKGKISVRYNNKRSTSYFTYTLTACDKDGNSTGASISSASSYSPYQGYFKLTVKDSALYDNYSGASIKEVSFCVGAKLTAEVHSGLTHNTLPYGIPTGSFYYSISKESEYTTDSSTGEEVFSGFRYFYRYYYYDISNAVVHSIGDNFIVFYGYCTTRLSGSTVGFDVESASSDAPDATKIGFQLTGDPIPQMDYVFEHENRIWGCRYGKNYLGEQVNEIYASALGNFRNFSLFENVSTDAFVQGVGTEGPFTGACSYNGYPYFFKERGYHKVYGLYPAQYQVQAVECKGVQNGSFGSMVTMNGLLYYKAVDAVCSFDGSYPTDISYSLGDRRYAYAVGGSHRYKYYLSMKDIDTGEWSLFVYNALYGLWHKEDDLCAVSFCDTMQTLYCATSDNSILDLTSADAPEDSAPWSFETGMIACETVDRKFLQSISARLSLSIGGTLHAFIEYDSSGQWEHLFRLAGTSTNTFTIPITPQRCDHFRLKFSGTGDMKLFALAKAYTKGSAY